MRKIAININYGGFQLSPQAVNLLSRLTGTEVCAYDVVRDDVDVIYVVELLGDMASADLGSIKIVEIPDDVAWVIAQNDGYEWVAEVHRTWHHEYTQEELDA